MDKRKLVFFGLVLMVIGLSVILGIAKLTNKIIIAKSNNIISRSLKNMEGIKINDEFENNVKLEQLSDKYTKIELNSLDKVTINQSILDYGVIHKILELRQYTDSKYNLCFLNGSISAEEIDNLETNEVEDIYLNKYILKIDSVYAENENENIYDVYIDDVYPKDSEKVDYFKNVNVVDYMNSDIVNSYKLRVEKTPEGKYQIIGIYCYNFKY